MITVNCPAHGPEKRDERFAEIEEAIRIEDYRNRPMTQAELSRRFRERRKALKQEEQKGA